MAFKPSKSSGKKSPLSSSAKLPEPSVSKVSNDALLQAAASLVPSLKGNFTAACFRAKQMGELIGGFPEYEAIAQGDLRALFTKERGWKDWKGGVCWVTELSHFDRAEPAFLDFIRTAKIYCYASSLFFRGQLIRIVVRGVEHWQKEGFLESELLYLRGKFRSWRFSS